MTPGSMLGVCYSDGSCEQLEGADFAATVARIKGAAKLDAVREVSLRAFRQHLPTTEIVRAFGRLAKLELEYCDACDVTALIGVASLRALTLVQAPQSALSAVAKLVQLENLDLRQGSFTKLGDLGALTSLVRLDLSGSKVSSLAGLEKTRLAELELARAPVADLKPLQELISLRTLGLRQTAVRDLKPIAKLTKLEELIAAETSVDSLAPLSALTALTTVDVSETSVADLAPLAGLTKLRELTLSSTRVKSLAPLHASRALTFLYLTKGAQSAGEIAALQRALPDCQITY